MFSTKSFLFCITLFVSIVNNANPQPCPDVEKLRIVPGYGWDALTNNDTKQLMKWTYTQCLLTTDGRFLIPDNTIAVPLKIMDKQIEAEIFEHWSNYTALSSASFKVATDIWPEEFLPLYYSFSDDYQEMKSIQVKNDAFTCRSQIRQVIYRIKTTSDAPMSEIAKERFLQVITARVRNNTEEARYLTEMIVRNYGTHYTTSVDVGMVFAMEHYLSNAFLKRHTNNESQILSASELSLLEYITNTGFSLEDQQQQFDSTLLNEYKKATLKKKLRFSSGLNWEQDGTSENMLAIDRSGDMLPTLITSSNFPIASPAMLANVRQLFGDVIRNYYMRNAYRGCTQPKSTHFDYAANLDDGNCKSAVSDYVFGGVYCSFKRLPYVEGDEDIGAKNPLTGDFSCPPNFQSQLFYSYYYYHSSDYQVWNFVLCTAMANDSFAPSYLLGGFYSNHVDNIQTKARSCPPFYTALSLRLEGWTFCVSSPDNDLAKPYALHFGGFATVDTDFQCPGGYKRHYALPFGVTVYATGLGTVNYGKVYYCLQEENVKNLDVVPSLVRFPFVNG